jgi:hypothetical protein
MSTAVAGMGTQKKNPEKGCRYAFTIPGIVPGDLSVKYYIVF